MTIPAQEHLPIMPISNPSGTTLIMNAWTCIGAKRFIMIKFPLIHAAVNHQDSDVSEFAKVDISARIGNRNLR